jgi:hypothetical protein
MDISKVQELLIKSGEAKEAQKYLQGLFKAYRQEIWRMVQQSPNQAQEAHYLLKAMFSIEQVINGDIQQGKKAERGEVKG